MYELVYSWLLTNIPPSLNERNGSCWNAANVGLIRLLNVSVLITQYTLFHTTNAHCTVISALYILCLPPGEKWKMN